MSGVGSSPPSIDPEENSPLRAQSKEFLINNYSDLCELRVSAVK